MSNVKTMWQKTGNVVSVFLRAVKRCIWLFPPLIVMCSMLITYSRNGLYPFGNKTVSWCDMDQQVVPLLLDFKNILEGKEGFFFSFQNAGGMNFFGVFFFFLSSPFSFLVAFVDRANVMLFANVLVLLKMCVISCTASVYFEKKYKRGYLMNVILSVLYAYSGYVMMYFQNVIWLDIVYMFPLLLLGLERLKERKRGLFIVALAACVAINYYIAYMLVVFLLLYAFVYVYLEKDKIFAGNFLLCCGVAAFLSAIVWLPSLLQYFSSGRKSSIVDSLRSSAILSPYETTFPTIFSILFIFPFALSRTHKADKDNHLRYILFLLTLVPIVFEPINKMWQTGNYMSFPTRYAFITIFLCLTLTMDCIVIDETEGEKGAFLQRITAAWKGEKWKKELPRYVLGLISALLAIWYCVYARSYTAAHYETMDQYSHSLWGNAQSFNALLSLYSVALLIGVLLYVLYRIGLLKQTVLWVCIAVMAVSEIYVAPMTYMLTPAHDVSYHTDIVELADKIDDEEFYRVKTDRSYSWRDFDVNMMGAIGYNALGHYTSLTADNYMTAIKRFGYSSYWMEVGNEGGTVLTDALLSVKYIISEKQREEDVYQGNYYHIAPTEYYLPMGIVTAKDVIGEERAEYVGRGELQSVLYQDFFGNSDGVSVYTLEDAILQGVTVEKTREKYLLTPDLTGGKIKFQVPMSALEQLYFNVFDENTNALNQAINQKFSVSSSKVSISSFPTQKNNGLLFLGEYDKATMTTVTITIKEQVSVTDLSIIGIKTNALQSAIAQTKTLGLKEKKNGLIGNYTAQGGECVFLSVPYTDGMRLTINGKRTPLYEVYDGFTAFYLTEGDNEIELTFQPKGFGVGVAISCLGVGLLIALWSVRKKTGEQLALPAKVETCAYYGVLSLGIAVVCVVYIAPLILCVL